MSGPPSQKNTEINSQLSLHREQSCSEDFSPSFLSCLFRKSRGTGKPRSLLLLLSPRPGSILGDTSDTPDIPESEENPWD